MRIAFDLSALRTTGTLVYCQGFLPAFVKLLGNDDELTIFGPSHIEDIVKPLTGRNVRFVGNPVLRKVPARICWQQFVLPGLLRKIQADVLFAAFDMGPWFDRCPMVVGVRNPTPILLDGALIPMSWKYRVVSHLHKLFVSNTCRRARLMTFPSRYAADAVGGRLPGRADRRRVVHHGLDTEFWEKDPVAGSAARGKYILFASKFYIQKRAPLLLEAFAEWRKRNGRTDYRLIYCGEEAGSAAAQAVVARAAELGLADSVQMRGIVPRSELRRLCQEAAVLALPTVMETFGFPYIEAMVCRTPLVCADIEVARELCGNTPYYFRPDDRDSLAEALEAALAEGPDREARLAAGALRANDFSWQREARETLACLREALSLP